MRLKYLFIGVLICQLQVLTAQNAQSVSLLWKISGNNLKQSSYLYGTIHLQDERVFFMEEIVFKYIDMCDAFAIEVILDEIDPARIQNKIQMKNNSLRDLMTNEEYLQVDEYMKTKTGQPLMFYNKMKPFFIATMLMQQELGKERELAMDLFFLNYAKNANKLIFGLETFEEQIKAVDKISLKDQTIMLMKVTEESENQNTGIEKFINTYISQNIEHLYDLTAQDTVMPSKSAKYFIDKRNIRMTKEIIKLSEKHSVFVAVGAAHLGGPSGIIVLLRKKGYNVEPVFW